MPVIGLLPALLMQRHLKFTATTTQDETRDDAPAFTLLRAHKFHLKPYRLVLGE